jgi:pullulanase
VVVMANSNGAMPLMIEVIHAIAHVHGWADWQPLSLATLNTRLQSTPLYLRGSMNQWGLGTPLQRVGAMRFAAELALPAGPVEFKVGAADWSAVDLGQAPGTAQNAAQNAALSTSTADASLVPAGPNLALQVTTAGRYRFEVESSASALPVLRVQRLD